jgi:rod shape determining protein RodA
MTFLSDLDSGRDSFFGRLRRIEWGLVFSLAMIATVGAILLFGAAGGKWEPWAGDHIIRFTVVTCVFGITRHTQPISQLSSCSFLWL